jgi:hypothetical protein
MIPPIRRCAARPNAGGWRISPEVAGRERAGRTDSAASGLRQFSNIFFRKSETNAIIGIVMSEVRSFFYEAGELLMAKAGTKNFFCPGGHDKRLKRLIPDKEFQGNQSPFLGKIWLGLGSAWLGFDIFCFGLDIQQ